VPKIVIIDKVLTKVLQK